MAEDQTADNELGPETIEFQLALALATLTVAFVQTLRELQLQDRTEDALGHLEK